MNEEQKQQYHEKYAQKKQKGVKFYPDIVYKDMLVAFAVFLLLIMLATFIGVKNEPRVDPNDTTYVPRPEWYFMFLFQMLKYFPGKIEWIGTAVIPGLAVLALFLLPFFDRNTHRHWSKRKLAISIMSVVVLGIVALTILAVVTTPSQAEVGTTAATLTEQISAGQDLYSLNCVECHGPEGEGGVIQGVQGLEGFKMKPLKSQDEMYTRTDDALFNIINFGQPGLGMQPFGRAYGGSLAPDQITSIVTFMRYTWDDRAEMPKGVAQAGVIPTLAPDQTPSYEVNIAPIIKRYCISCHQAGKKNNNLLLTSYQEMMSSGDHAPNIKPGDLTSNLIRMINREEIDAGGAMPPTKALPTGLVDIFQRWVQAGVPNTPADAAKVTPSPTGTTP